MGDSEILYNYKRDVFWHKGAGILGVYSFIGQCPNVIIDTDNHKPEYHLDQSYFGHCCACGKNTLIAGKTRKEIYSMIKFNKNGHRIYSDDYDDYDIWQKKQKHDFYENGFVCAHCGRDYRPSQGGDLLKNVVTTRGIASHPNSVYVITKLTVEKKDNKIIVKSDIDNIILQRMSAYMTFRKYYYYCFELSKKIIYAMDPGYRYSKAPSEGRDKPTYKLPKRFFPYSPFYDPKVSFMNLFNGLIDKDDSYHFFTVLSKALGLSNLDFELDKYYIPQAFCLNKEKLYESKNLINIYEKLLVHLNNAVGCYCPKEIFGIEYPNSSIIFNGWLTKIRSFFKHNSLADCYLEMGKPENLGYIVYFLKRDQQDSYSFSKFFHKEDSFTPAEKAAYATLLVEFLALVKDKDAMAKFEKHLMSCKNYRSYNRCRMLNMVA